MVRSLTFASLALFFLSIQAIAQFKEFPGFYCEPASLKSEASCVLHLPDTQFGDLAIIDPSGVWHWLQDKEGNYSSLIAAEYFTQVERVSLDTATLKGIIYADGERQRSKVFSVPGMYRVLIADNLETEPEKAKGFSTTIEYLGEVLDGASVTAHELKEASKNKATLYSSFRLVPYFRRGKAIGVRLFALKPKSLAAKFGLKNGDIILSIDGVPASDINDIPLALVAEPKEKLKVLKIERDRNIVVLQSRIAE